MWTFALACCPIPDILPINSVAVLSKQFSDLNLSSALAVTYQRLGSIDMALVIKAPCPRAHCDIWLLSLFIKAPGRCNGGAGHLKEAT